MHTEKQHIGQLIRAARLAKGYTQADLAEITKVSLRSVQRIENGEVNARAYTLKTLATALNVEFAEVVPQVSNRGLADVMQPATQYAFFKTVMLSLIVGVCLVFFGAAYLSQSVSFPETHFELFIFWGVLATVYLAIVIYVFKISAPVQASA